MAIQQLLREGRLAMAELRGWPMSWSHCWGGVTYSLDVQGQASLRQDSSPVTYPRKRLRSIGIIGRLHLPLPSRTLISLLTSSEPLHGHLPSPGVCCCWSWHAYFGLVALLLAHWHCFLETTPGLSGFCLGFISGLLCGPPPSVRSGHHIARDVC